MGYKIEIPDSLLSLGGLKVALQNSLEYTVDTIGTRRHVNKQVVLSANTISSNGSWAINNAAGGSNLLVHWNVTAVTISSGQLFFLVQKAMPNDATWTTILSHQITATENRLVQVNAQSDSTSAFLSVNAFPTVDTVYHGPWNLLRVQLYGSGSYSCTLSVNSMVQ